MYIQDYNEILSRFLAQADESFQAAEYCFEKKLYRDSLNRSYYAAFDAVKAVIALAGVDFKRHKDAVAYFNQHYVKDGPVSRDIGRKLGRLKQYREEGDYGDFNVISEEELQQGHQNSFIYGEDSIDSWEIGRNRQC